jgi:broad specificity phosphatase PhoE
MSGRLCEMFDAIVAGTFPRKRFVKQCTSRFRGNAGRDDRHDHGYLVQHGEKQRLPGDPGLTDLGRQQATRTGWWLSGLGVGARWTSPMRRARETADCIAEVTGLAVQPDARLRERLNWDGGMPFEAFLALWARTTRDRDLVPAGGQSARQAAVRLQAFLVTAMTEHRRAR